MMSLEFFIDTTLRPHYDPGVAQPLTEVGTRNTSGGGGKGGRCVGLTLPPSCADCLEIWEPHLLGTLRACPDL